MRGCIALCIVAVLSVSCSDADSLSTLGPRPDSSTPPQASAPVPAAALAASPPIRLLFAGDVMLGRRVADIVQLDSQGLFEDVRFVVSSADIAVANLESPLTLRPQVVVGEELSADPASAGLLAAAGFDAVGIANNHAGDAGSESVLDTIAALEAASLRVVGAGSTAQEAYTPQIIERRGVRVAYIAFDATGQGLAAGDTPGIATWNVAAVQAAVAAAREEADVVAVGLHGGIEYSTITDPQLQRLGETLAGWNVDIVWGHGSHVSQPVRSIDPDGDGHFTVVATSLGNFLFDQSRRSTTTGTVLEVLAGSDGVAAWRVGVTEHEDLRVHFDGWKLPTGNAVLLNAEWWNLPQVPEVVQAPEPLDDLSFPYGTVVDAGRADVTGDGIEDLVVAYRHPFRPTGLGELFPNHDFVDAEGRSAHIGVFEVETFRPVWGAGTLFEPIERVLPCDSGIAVGYSELDDQTVIAAGALIWRHFGFAAAPILDGGATLGCSDIDRDGTTDPVVIDRVDTL